MKITRIKRSEASTLSKAVSNISKIIKKKKDVKQQSVKKNVIKEKLLNSSKQKKKEKKEFKSTRGIVYIGHIPYGFFEAEMKEYFEQFGKVTRVRVARSKKTGKSRGYGYIEFEFQDVAKIAAETMNNYLMCGRLLKATYIPPEKQHWGFFSGKSWNPVLYPKLTNRMKELKKMDEPISDKQHKQTVKRSLKKLSLLEEKLNSIGIDIKLKPVNT